MALLLRGEGETSALVSTFAIRQDTTYRVLDLDDPNIKAGCMRLSD